MIGVNLQGTVNIHIRSVNFMCKRFEKEKKNHIDDFYICIIFSECILRYSKCISCFLGWNKVCFTVNNGQCQGPALSSGG